MSSVTKNSLDSLAVFSGVPAFAESVHVGRPNLGDKTRFLQRIEGILDRRWLTNDGVCVRELEQRIADFTGVRHCIAICNGTIALELATRSLDLSGEVIVPSFTFIATAHSLQWQQIRPVFCDIDPATHNLDPNEIEKLITDKTTAILGVHVWGRPCCIDALERIAAKHDLKLIFDAAHAFGCSSGGKMIGGFGNAEVMSFHATKFFNTLEGGAILTNDDDLAKKIRLMRNFGFAGYDNVIYIGTNGKMNEVSAAMGLTLLEGMDELLASTKRNYDQYRNELVGLPGVMQISYNEEEKCNHQYVVLEIGEEAVVDRDTLLAVLHAENVIARRYFHPGCHRMEPYRSSPAYGSLSLPWTERLCRRVLVLPSGVAVGESEIRRIAGIIRLAVENGAELVDRIGATAAARR